MKYNFKAESPTITSYCHDRNVVSITSDQPTVLNAPKELEDMCDYYRMMTRRRLPSPASKYAVVWKDEVKFCLKLSSALV